MKLPTRLVFLTAVVLAGCDDDDGGMQQMSDAAVLDAPEPVIDADLTPDGMLDAAPPTPSGSWRLIGMTVPDAGGTTSTIHDNDTLGLVPQRVNGLLLLDAVTGEAANTFAHLYDDRMQAHNGFAGTFSWNASFTTLTLGGAQIPATWVQEPAEYLTLGTFPNQLIYERLVQTPPNPQMVSAIANVTIESPGNPFVTLVQPRVALVNLLRGDTGGLDYVQVPTVPPALPLDVAMPGDFGDDAADTSTYASARTDGALGLERIDYGAAGVIAVMVLVAYEDRDGSGSLSRLAVDGCPGATTDCIRGFSKVFIAYRVGASAELLASRYDQLLPGWQHAIEGNDERFAGPTLVPLDPQPEEIPLDVEFAEDPGSVTLPDLTFD